MRNGTQTLIELALGTLMLLTLAFRPPFPQVSAGTDFTCVLDETGQVTCSGSNQYGQTTPPALEFSRIAVGGHHACGLRDGAPVCWGDNTSGQTDAPSKVFVQLSAGEAHTCGLAIDRRVTCWGDNTYGQTDVPERADFIQVVAGRSFTCALTHRGQAICWGSSAYRQTVAPQSLIFTQLAAGGDTACGIISRTKELYCWGQSIAKLDGRMRIAEILPATLIASFSDDRTPRRYGTAFVQAAVGWRHICGLLPDATARCWGDNTYGQTDVPPDTLFFQLSAGAFSSCGITNYGEVKCWGRTGSNPSLIN